MFYIEANILYFWFIIVFSKNIQQDESLKKNLWIVYQDYIQSLKYTIL